MLSSLGREGLEGFGEVRGLGVLVIELWGDDRILVDFGERTLRNHGLAKVSSRPDDGANLKADASVASHTSTSAGEIAPFYLSYLEISPIILSRGYPGPWSLRCAVAPASSDLVMECYGVDMYSGYIQQRMDLRASRVDARVIFWHTLCPSLLLVFPVVLVGFSQ